MNLIITETLFKQLTSYTLASWEFGSDNEKSDKDIIHVINPDFDFEAMCPYYRGHFLQYKQEGVDHIVVSFSQLLTSLVQADNVVVYKMMDKYKLGNDLHIDMLKIAYNHNMFISYKMLKSFLGVAKRDLSDVVKLRAVGNDFSNRKANKKYKFVFDAILYVANKLHANIIVVHDTDNLHINVTTLRDLLNSKLSDRQLPFVADVSKIGLVPPVSCTYEKSVKQQLTALYLNAYTIGN